MCVYMYVHKNLMLKYYALYAKTIKVYDRISSSRNSGGDQIQRLVERKAEVLEDHKNNISCPKAYALYAKTIKLYDIISSSRKFRGRTEFRGWLKGKQRFMRTI